MSSHGLTKENLLRSLPISLSGDPKMVALADAIAGVLAERLEEIRRVSIYPRIDQLDESLLDILARDFKVDWWDSDYSLEEKRRTLAGSWQVHKTLGTKAAVEKALRAVYPRTEVKEWFDYGGEPYHFRLEVDITNDTKNSEKQERVLKLLNYYKSLRSHLDSLRYFVYFDPVFLENQNRLQLVSVNLKTSLREREVLCQRLHHFRVSASEKNMESQGASWSGRWSAREENLGEWHGITASFHGPNNLGIMEYRLNGRHDLDGSWRLGDGFGRGLSFAGFLVNSRFCHPETITAVLGMRARVQSPAGTAAGARFRAEGANRGGLGPSLLQVSGYGKNPQKTQAFAVADTRWRLDGAYRLNGGKKLKADIERSEL